MSAGLRGACFGVSHSGSGCLHREYTRVIPGGFFVFCCSNPCRAPKAFVEQGLGGTEVLRSGHPNLSSSPFAAPFGASSLGRTELLGIVPFPLICTQSRWLVKWLVFH